MKKLIPLIVVGIIVISGLGSIATTDNANHNVKTEKESISLSEPIIKESGKYVVVSLEEATSSLKLYGKPILPVVTKVFTLPFGSKIDHIDVHFSDANALILSEEVQPGSEPFPLIAGTQVAKEPVKNMTIYNSEELYPSDSYNYFTGAGLEDEKHVIYLVIQCHPIRYAPIQNTIYYFRNIDINVSYKEHMTPTLFTDEYDLVIIAPEQFTAEIQPLVDHKNRVGVNTFLKTTEDIYNQYDGVDKPEQIKYFIKDAFDNFGIRYVLLVGGLNSLIYAERRDDPNQGSNDWLVPVRYTNMNSGSDDDPGFISDLYYADIYEGEGNFSSWDSNEDGVFAAWKFVISRDILDLYPEVYVGRLPCRNTREVNTMVNKIIYYESSACDPSWFNKIVLVGGDTFIGGGIYEGEVETQKALDYMSGFESIKLWVSNKDTGGLVPEPDNIIETVSDGCGFLHFAGHGSPELWYTYYPNHETKTDKFMWFSTPRLSNGDKLPVCVVGSCHGSQFNVTALSFIDLYLNRIGEKFDIDFLKRWPGNCGFPTPECFCWFLTRVSSGGTISTIGNTGIGIGGIGGDNDDKDGDGINDPDCVEIYGGYIETLFFKMYGKENIDILGETWGQAITNYLNVYPGMQDRTDAKTVEQWILFGDPSLKIGGYP